MGIIRDWLSRMWHGEAHQLQRATQEPASPSVSDDPVAELAALIDAGDGSQESLERVAMLLGQTDAKRSD